MKREKKELSEQERNAIASLGFDPDAVDEVAAESEEQFETALGADNFASFSWTDGDCNYLILFEEGQVVVQNGFPYLFVQTRATDGSLVRREWFDESVLDKFEDLYVETAIDDGYATFSAAYSDDEDEDEEDDEGDIQID